MPLSQGWVEGGMGGRAAEPPRSVSNPIQGVLFATHAHTRASVLLAHMAALLEELPALQGRASLRESREFAARHVRATGILTELSAERMLTLWIRFERYAARAHGVVTLGDVTPALARSFVSAKTTKGKPPGVATQHLRRSAIRLLFRILRQFRICTLDPTIDLHLPPRDHSSFRPLTDDEVDLCRWASRSTLTMTRRPAAWALAEAGASTAEMGQVTLADLDAREGRVWISGGPKTDPRWAALTEWGR